MSRVEIENKIENIKKDVYYSDTDRYDINLFSDEFRAKELSVYAENTSAIKSIEESVFNLPAAKGQEEYSELKEEIFAYKSLDIQYHNNENSNSKSYIISGIIMVIIFCFVCIYYFIKRKKNREDDNYICKYN